MIELPLAFLGGLLGSSHCIGMCGSFAVSIGVGSERLRSNLKRQLIYSAGRIFTYSFLGAAAAFIGLQLTGRLSHLVRMQAVLSVVAGIALVIQGSHSAGWLSWKRAGAHTSPCLSHSFFAPFLMARSWYSVFIAGLLTGLLPCGLVYAYLALAASTREIGGGVALMAAFGAGTVPLMVLAGLGASFFSLAARRHILKFAACCVMITGLLAVSRGAWFLLQSSRDEPARCPACEQGSRASSDAVGMPGSALYSLSSCSRSLGP